MLPSTLLRSGLGVLLNNKRALLIRTYDSVSGSRALVMSSDGIYFGARH